jgi:DUF2075 family protein
MSGINGVGGGNADYAHMAVLGKSLENQARQAGQAINTFSRVNDLIRDPDSNRPSLSQSMHESYNFNKEVLTNSMTGQMAKGTRLDALV